MKKIIIFIFMFIMSSHFAFAKNKIPIEILKIYDGDTIKVKIDNGNKFSIRLKGVDCYETNKIQRAYKQAYKDKINIDEVIKKGNKAQKYLKNLYIKSKGASFDFMGVDKYGRVLGIVYFDNLNVNEKLIKDSVCKAYDFKEE